MPSVLITLLSLTACSQVINRSGHHVNLFWVNTEDAYELVLEPQLPAPLKNGSKTFVITYTNHIFRIRLPNIKENPGISASIESDYVMGPKDVTIEVLIRDGQLVLDELTYFKEQVAGLKSSLEICGSPNKDGYVECIVSPIAEKMKAAELMNQEVVGAYDRMANTYRNYTCADETLETSAPIASSRIRIGADVLPVYYLLDTPHAKIWYVEDFILPSECKILMDHGRPRLERATVYNDKNGSFITSNKRKAQQAMYTVNGSDDPLA